MGYALLSKLQMNKGNKQLKCNSGLTFDKLSDIFEGQNNHKLNLLISALEKANMVVEVNFNDETRYLFPAALPVDEPQAIEDLIRYVESTLYGKFNIYVNFLSMELFSQWLAKWLIESEKNNNNPSVGFFVSCYSRYSCLIVDNLENTAVQRPGVAKLLVQWHPHYRVLTFSFYYSAKSDDSFVKTDYQERFTEIIRKVFATMTHGDAKVDDSQTVMFVTRQGLGDPARHNSHVKML